MKCWLAVAWTLVCLSSAAPALAVTVAPEAGMLLIARPDLPDPRFRDAVILLVQHGPQGAAGLILNRPSRIPLHEVLPKLPHGADEVKTLAYGGPVAPRAFMVLALVPGEPPEPSQKVSATLGTSKRCCLPTNPPLQINNSPGFFIRSGKS